MIEKQMRSILRDLTEQKAPKVEINLWPAIESRLAKARLQMSGSKYKGRGSKMNPRLIASNRLRFATLLTAALVLACGLFLITPQGQAWAQTMLRFFTRSESNIMPGVTIAPVTWVEQTPGVSAATSTPPSPPPAPAFVEACGTYDNPKCTVEQIRAKVSFPVFQLAEIPDGLYFTGATGNPDRIHIVFQTKNQSGRLFIVQEPWTGSPDQKAWEVGASADIQTVKVGAVIAEYVKGSYFSDGSRDELPKWNSDIDVQSLRWVDHGILFNLEINGFEPPMDRDALAALIGSLTTEPIAAATPMLTRTPAEDPVTSSVAFLRERFALSTEQAEKAAGFSLHLPSRLPEGLAFMGARYEPDLDQVIVFYHHSNHGTDGLSLSEQTAPNSGECGLCGFVLGEGTELDKTAPGKVIGKNAKTETVQIGNVKGEYVEGVWSGTEQGWVWDSTPYLKSLRWSVNDMAYELQYMGMWVTKEDLIAIANSIQ